ncbi:MAG: YccF domain-containing protein [Rhodospirillaceae bacterium]|nr:YccF domain-containing protein [Rhodospirillaceae bacterium]
MGPGSLLLNVIWIVFGGGAMALGWFIAGCVIAITIIGLPWAPAAFRIALYTLIPFGQSVAEHKEAGPLSLVGNIIWFVLAGWWLALGHLFWAIVLGITIVGLPFAWAHLKLARLSLMPVGTVIVRAS